MFVELMDKRKNHFARLRAEEQRRKPQTKAQKRRQMKQNTLKRKNYDEIQKLFDKAMTRVNMFVGMDTKLVKESSKKAEMVQESSSKRAEMRPGEAYERVLWGDLKVMFEPDVESENLHIFMLVEKKYPLTPATITEMLNKKLQADHWNEMCYQLLKLMTKQLKNPGSGRIVGIKRLHDDLGVNTAKVRVTAAKHNLVLLVILVKNMLSISAAGIKVNAAGYNC
ncbi:hypothetical protein Tco_1231936 [Tanacetum coccineum]